MVLLGGAARAVALGFAAFLLLGSGFAAARGAFAVSAFGGSLGGFCERGKGEGGQGGQGE